MSSISFLSRQLIPWRSFPMSANYLRQDGYVIVSVCLCLFSCLLAGKSSACICVNILLEVGLGLASDLDSGIFDRILCHHICKPRYDVICFQESISHSDIFLIQGFSLCFMSRGLSALMEVRPPGLVNDAPWQPSVMWIPRLTGEWLLAVTGWNRILHQTPP